MDMRKVSKSAVAALVLGAGYIASAQAVMVTINMTADNINADGGLCATASCVGGTGWSSLGATPNASNWQRSDSITIDLGGGTHYFAWNVTNLGAASSGNPAALLAEILWDGNANYSSSAWEIYDINTGSALANATQYGTNGGSNIWTSVNRGAVSGISTNANWIYTANNFANASPSAWIRTSITIASVPEPASLALMGLGLLGLGFASRRKAKAA